MQSGDWTEAERGYLVLTSAKPNWAWHNLGLLYLNTGRLAAAEAALRRALDADATQLASRYSLSSVVLRQGRYAEGWDLYESRRQVAATGVPAPRLGYPEWRGEDLAGKRLLVIREQGLGDQIMLARFLPELERRGAEVTFLCASSLVALLESNGARTAPAVAGQGYPDADLWVLAFSLPRLLGVALESLDGSPYLKAEPRVVGGIGVKVAGAPSHVNDRHRSLPPRQAQALLARGRDLDPAATGAADFKQTAEIVAGLDLVVTVDTAVAHLAGALGKPAWILLSAYDTDWRWLEGRTDSPWYNSVRLYRQAKVGAWEPVIEQVLHDLDRLGRTAHT